MSEQSLLRYKITEGAFGDVTIYLDKPGQQIVAEGGAMIYMTGSVTMSTKSTGGFMKGLKRTFSGESMFQNYFELKEGEHEGSVTFAPGIPGAVKHMHLTQGEAWTLSQGAYIAGTPSVQVDTRKGGVKQMFGGEGFFLVDIKTEAEGDVWLGCYGAIERHEIKPGEEFIVDNGVMLAFQSHMEYSMSKVGGKKSFILGGEGIVIKYKGPGIIYTQNRDLGALATLLKPFFPGGR